MAEAVGSCRLCHIALLARLLARAFDADAVGKWQWTLLFGYFRSFLIWRLEFSLTHLNHGILDSLDTAAICALVHRQRGLVRDR